jgi:hypothetical protein
MAEETRLLLNAQDAERIRHLMPASGVESGAPAQRKIRVRRLLLFLTLLLVFLVFFTSTRG